MPFVPVDINAIKLDQAPIVSARSTGGFVPVDINTIKLDAAPKSATTAMDDYRSGIKTANEQAGVFDTLKRSIPLGLKKAAAGGLELVGNTMEAVGLPVDQERMADLAAAQREYEARGTGTGVTGAVGELLGDPTNYIPAAGLTKAATLAAAQGLMSPTGNENSSLGDNAQNAVLSGLAGAGGQLAASGIGRIVKPVRSSIGSNAQKLAGVLEKEGVNLTAAQKTGSTPLATLESVFETLPFTSSSQRNIYQKQQEKFTQAALKKAGIDAPDASREVIEAASQKFGAAYNDLAKRNKLKIDDDLLGKVYNTYQNANSGRMGTDANRLVNAVASDLFNGGKEISGEVYHNTRKMLTQKAQSATDQFDAGALRELRNALDEAFERGLSAADKGKMKALNTEYGAFKTIKKAAESSNTGSVRDAMLNPTALYNADRVGSNLSELSDAGAAYLRPQVPNSGTAQRAGMQALLQGSLTAGGAGLAGYGATNDSNLATGVGLALAGPRAVQKLYNSRAGQAYLTKGLGKTAERIAGGIDTIAAKAASAAQRNGMDIPAEQEAQTVPLDSMLRGPQIDLPQVGVSAGGMMASGALMNQEAMNPQNEFVRKLTAIESSGNSNAKNPNSSATGKAQFIDSTWNHIVSKYGKEYGLTRKGRTDPRQAELAAMLYAQENSNALAKKIGREPQEHELYLAHFLGAGGAGKLLQSDPRASAAQVLPRAAASNQRLFFQNGKPLTVAQLYENIANKWKDA